MKKQLPAFLTGFLAAVLVLSLSLSSFAAITGKTTIEVGPISIMVKGEIFQPTDVNGNPVDVFVYKGTTYAPLRALAEAYGLEVSYDGEAKMAVVEEPEEAVEPSAQPVIPGDYSDWSEEEEAAYQEFKSLWWPSVETRSIGGTCIYLYPYYLEETQTKEGEEAIVKFLCSAPIDKTISFCIRLDSELYQEYKIPHITYCLPVFLSAGWADVYRDNGWVCGYYNFYQTNKSYYPSNQN